MELNPFLAARLLAMLFITMVVATALTLNPDSIARLAAGGLACIGVGLLVGPKT